MTSDALMEMQVEASLAQLDSLLERGPNHTAAGVWGAALGALAGYFVIKRREPAERHVVKYALYGAGVNLVLNFGAWKLAKTVSRVEHEMLGIPAPMTPVVTKGAFAGAPRALYRAHHPFERHQSHNYGQDQDQDQDQTQQQDQHWFHHQQHHQHHR